MKSKERIKARGEIFTPPALINEMLDKLPVELWSDPTKTWLDNSAGSGNFLVEVKRRLLEHHCEEHILENMIFGVEINADNVMEMQERLGYLVNGKQNTKLSNFSEEVLDEECLKFVENWTGTTYLHHRNIVCFNALKYDYSFGRSIFEY